jgi:prevent-host-death family protein
MTNIRPSSDMRSNYSEISRQCKETGAPIYLTVNGKGDLVVMDIKQFDILNARLELFIKLASGIKSIEEGKTYSHEEVFAKFKE